MSSGVPPDNPDQFMTAWKSFQLNLTRFGEEEACGLGGLDGFGCFGGDQDLAPAGLVGDPRRERDAAAEEITVLLERRSSVDTDPDPDRRAAESAGSGVQLTLDLDRRANRVFGTGEGDHEPVTLRLHDVPAVPAGASSDDLVVGTESPEGRPPPLSSLS